MEITPKIFGLYPDACLGTNFTNSSEIVKVHIALENNSLNLCFFILPTQERKRKFHVVFLGEITNWEKLLPKGPSKGWTHQAGGSVVCDISRDVCLECIRAHVQEILAKLQKKKLRIEGLSVEICSREKRTLYKKRNISGFKSPAIPYILNYIHRP